MVLEFGERGLKLVSAIKDFEGKVFISEVSEEGLDIAVMFTPRIGTSVSSFETRKFHFPQF